MFILLTIFLAVPLLIFLVGRKHGFTTAPLNNAQPTNFCPGISNQDALVFAGQHGTCTESLIPEALRVIPK
jgi:hypothetical protein